MSCPTFLLLTFSSLLIILVGVQSVAVPIVVLHGYSAKGDQEIPDLYQTELSVYAKGIEPSEDADDAVFYGMNTPIKEQGKRVGNLINADSNYNGDFDIVGYSQGAIISRYVIQKGNLIGRVRRFVSMGGPINGTGRQKGSKYDFLGIAKNHFLYYAIFSNYVQNNWPWSNWEKSPSYYNEYIQYSNFLAEYNNEKMFSQEIKDKFMAVDKFLFIKFNPDAVIFPSETSWWGEYDKKNNILHKSQTPLYIHDLIGLKELDEQGRTTYVQINRNHLLITTDEMQTYVFPFLSA